METVRNFKDSFQESLDFSLDITYSFMFSKRFYLLSLSLSLSLKSPLNFIVPKFMGKKWPFYVSFLGIGKTRIAQTQNHVGLQSKSNKTIVLCFKPQIINLQLSSEEIRTRFYEITIKFKLQTNSHTHFLSFFFLYLPPPTHTHTNKQS